MKNKNIIKCVFFITIFFVLLSYVTKIMVPDYFYDKQVIYWPTTGVYKGFYEMEEDTIDVLVFGSSTSATSFIPQVLYEEYGISSYNLSCEQQNVVVSYYWLKEALKYQKPKAVILECKLVFPYSTSEPLNSSETMTRKAIDPMRLSKVKIEAIKDITTLDESQSAFSYYFPIIRFHDRWSELTYIDSVSYYNEMINHYEHKGYTPFASTDTNIKFTPIDSSKQYETTETAPLMEEYVDKMKVLCDENDIEFILMQTPGNSDTPERYTTLQNYANNKDITYIDFNVDTFFNEINFDYNVDAYDSRHQNYIGATKITRYIGSYLASNLEFDKRELSQFEATKSFYKHFLINSELSSETNLYKYIDTLSENLDRYSIFITVNNAVGNDSSKPLNEILGPLGINNVPADLKGSSYLAIVSNNEKFDLTDNKLLEKKGRLLNGSKYTIKSGGASAGKSSSIVINNKEWSKNKYGLNIVVYDNESLQVIDSIVFDMRSNNTDGKR